MPLWIVLQLGSLSRILCVLSPRGTMAIKRDCARIFRSRFESIFRMLTVNRSSVQGCHDENQVQRASYGCAIVCIRQLEARDCSSYHSSKIKEYCQWDHFNATCPRGNVIVMETARYGRMEVGRCISIEYEVGCSANVLRHVDDRCSGRRSCSIGFPDSDLFKVQPCRKDLVAYFTASYSCVQVAGGGAPSDPVSPSTPCNSKLVLTQPSGFIASSITRRSSLGSHRCPWSIKVAPGQRIQLSLLDFSSGMLGSPRSTSVRYTSTPNPAATLKKYSCPVCAVVRETYGANNIYLCDDDNSKSVIGTTVHSKRQRVVFMSKRNVLDVHLVNVSSSSRSSETNFLLKYEASRLFPDRLIDCTNSSIITIFATLRCSSVIEASVDDANANPVGCPDVEAPFGTWLDRTGDTLMLACNFTTERWHLVCRGTSWVGTIRNCSKVAPLAYSSRCSKHTVCQLYAQIHNCTFA
ncbi:hypothetical protein CAPTEDRAFT_211921 [Capitella teleta]|uniref:SUEL-type lectin domain-containing protein n=1 Tax=Capitella teleta TaxID=283909 RepID=R7UMK1_CAPTE|nr:hypothetical protein CAPTEDRAFT_211921 [Capitella teleta]|eukprot:ELU04472.1 hypothetical protein CAPTEDRAFT_211921 [Capitella teleta]